MLKRWLAVTAAILALFVARVFAVHAQGDEADEALRRPERMTVGTKDQFLGQLAPDGKTLYFVSNRETRKEIYAQDLDEGRARIVFDEGADVTWPRVSPDGKLLLYISFSELATGQLCVRELPDGANRRCLGNEPAALQAEWIDATRAVLVGRTSIGGDLRVSEVTIGSELSSRTLFEQNWTSPTVSPDGKWLVYVPLDRVTKAVGPGFAARTSRRLEAVRLDGVAAPVPFVVDLPGMTGQPTFSRDGRFLYFVQFFSDSNRDGLIDASDNGVLFRVPFPSHATDAPAQAAASAPLQLTDSGLNCQYPAPAPERLITTCSRAQKLDIYELPLDGEVPGDWDGPRLRAEVAVASRRSEQLLLYRHALEHASTLTWRRLITMRLVMAHLQLEEFDAAEFYAQKVKALRDPATRGIGQPLLTLVEHRRQRSARERARVIEDLVSDAQAQLDQLVDGPKDSPAARAMNRIVRSEIADAMGDKGAARRELEAAVIDDDTPRAVIEVYFARADALYRELDDREALVAVCRRFATSKELKEEHRLDYARAAVRAMVRGLPFDEADALLEREREAEPGDSELGFALDLVRAVLAIRDGKRNPELKARLLALYDAQPRLDRRRAIVFDAVQRAAEAGSDGLIEGLSERYVEDVAPGTQERRRADRLYRRAILGRAFRRLARGRFEEARADFDEVFRRTGALEAVVSSVDLRLFAGKTHAEIETELELSSAPASLASFVRAYLIACDLPELAGEQHAAALERARSLLRSTWTEYKNKTPVRALYGYLMHQEYLSTRAQAAAERANLHYMVALELARNDPRYQAMLLGQLGLLHTAVGNYRIALGYFEQRERLPFGEDLEAFAVRLSMGRALLHVGKEEEAAEKAEQALALLDRVPTLAAFRVLALDRAALANLAAHHFERALTLYDAELPLLTDDASLAGRRNRFVVRLAHAAAAVGAGQPKRALDDLAAIEPSLEDSRLVAALAPSHGTPKRAEQSYRAIVAGLRANASIALGKVEGAAIALEQQRALFEERLDSSARDEDIRALALVETRLTENALSRRDTAAAAKWLALALDHADTLAARTPVGVDVDQLRVLWLGAELHARGEAPPDLEIPKRLSAAHYKLSGLHDASYRTYQRWFEIYLALAKRNIPAPSGAGRPQ